MCDKVYARMYECVSDCVYVWFYVCCMITVGVLVFVASYVWLFLLDFTILSLKVLQIEHSTKIVNLFRKHTGVYYSTGFK